MPLDRFPVNDVYIRPYGVNDLHSLDSADAFLVQSLWQDDVLEVEKSFSALSRALQRPGEFEIILQRLVGPELKSRSYGKKYFWPYLQEIIMRLVRNSDLPMANLPERVLVNLLLWFFCRVGLTTIPKARYTFKHDICGRPDRLLSDLFKPVVYYKLVQLIKDAPRPAKGQFEKGVGDKDVVALGQYFNDLRYYFQTALTELSGFRMDHVTMMSGFRHFLDNQGNVEVEMPVFFSMLSNLTYLLTVGTFPPRDYYYTNRLEFNRAVTNVETTLNKAASTGLVRLERITNFPIPYVLRDIASSRDDVWPACVVMGEVCAAMKEPSAALVTAEFADETQRNVIAITPLTLRNQLLSDFKAIAEIPNAWGVWSFMSTFYPTPLMWLPPWLYPSPARGGDAAYKPAFEEGISTSDIVQFVGLSKSDSVSINTTSTGDTPIMNSFYIPLRGSINPAWDVRVSHIGNEGCVTDPLSTIYWSGKQVEWPAPSDSNILDYAQEYGRVVLLSSKLADVNAIRLSDKGGQITLGRYERWKSDVEPVTISIADLYSNTALADVVLFLDRVEMTKRLHSWQAASSLVKFISHLITLEAADPGFKATCPTAWSELEIPEEFGFYTTVDPNQPPRNVIYPHMMLGNTGDYSATLASIQISVLMTLAQMLVTYIQSPAFDTLVYYAARVMQYTVRHPARNLDEAINQFYFRSHLMFQLWNWAYPNSRDVLSQIQEYILENDEVVRVVAMSNLMGDSQEA